MEAQRLARRDVPEPDGREPDPLRDQAIPLGREGDRDDPPGVPMPMHPSEEGVQQPVVANRGAVSGTRLRMR